MSTVINDPQAVSQPSANNVKRTAHESIPVAMLRALAVFGLGGWFYYKLTGIESGEIESTKVWGPIATLYNTLGFWPAVSLLPAIGCFVLYQAASRLVTETGEQRI